MKHGLQIRMVVIGLFMLLLVTPLDVSAEWYADLYTGAVFTKNTDLTIGSTLGSTATYQNLQVNNLDGWRPRWVLVRSNGLAGIRAGCLLFSRQGS